jgi:hypothetical protein
MQAQSAQTSVAFRWFLFFTALTTIAGGATWSILARARQMRTVEMAPSAFSAMPGGQSAKAVVFLIKVDGGKLSGILLQRKTDTVYRKPIDSVGSSISAELTPETAVVMGAPRDIVADAVVQLAGTLDASHVLHTTQVVVLTGYVRVENETASVND